MRRLIYRESEKESKPRSVIEAVVRHAQADPDKMCVADTWSSYTYGQFADLCVCVCGFFCSMGIGRADMVVVEAVQRAEYLATEFALHLLGAIFVPLESRCSEEKMLDTASFCGARMIVSQKPIGNDSVASCTWEDIRKEVFKTTNSNNLQFEFPAGNEISEILFSTGTTGREKGVVLNHINDIAVAENIIDGVRMEIDNVELIPCPINHSHGLRTCYANLFAGASVVLIDNLINLNRMFNVMDVYNVTSIDLVPAALTVIFKNSGDKIGGYKDVIRYFEFGSAPIPNADKTHLCQLFPDTPLYNFYGSTESGRTIIYNFNMKSPKDKCIGRPVRNAEVVMVDNKREIIFSSKDRPGLIATKGPMNMLGYWADPEETKDVMDDNGFIYTKDEAYYDEDGDIILLGRIGDVINVGGKKVDPEEIENIVMELEEVIDCGCIAVSDELSGQVPIVYVQCHPSALFDAKEIRDHISNHLESYKIPKRIIQIDKIPRSFNGKLLRRELQRLSLQNI